MNGTRRRELGGNLIAYRKKGKDMLTPTSAKNSESKEEDAEEFKYFSYPKDGTTKTIPVGDTKIDFYNGIIILPDGSREDTLTSLKEEGRNWARSIFVETNKDIKIWMDRGSITPVAQGNSIAIANAHFKVLWIQATEATEISAAASTNPEPIRKTKAEAPKAVLTLSGDYVVISGEITAVTDISGQTAFVVTKSGDYVVVSGDIRARISGDIIVAKTSGAVSKVSGETIIAKVSGEHVYAKTISGDYVVVSGEVSLPSTQAVKISGETVIGKTSGETNIAKISGETVIAKVSGEVVKISGEFVSLPPTQVVKISGETIIGKVSGDVVKISGEIVKAKISGETVKMSGEAVGIVAPMLIRGDYTPIGSIPPLSGGTYLSSGIILYVKVRNLPGNNNMWLAGSTVNSGIGLLLQGGEIDEFDIDNLNDVYLYAFTSGQLVSWRAIAE